MTESPHKECTIISRPKMDATGLVAAVCSCGNYTSQPGSEQWVRKCWKAHADQMDLNAKANGV